jgi:REP-associated tyrosine transposase
MPRGLVRYQQSQESHFVTFSCYRRLRLLDTPAMRDLVVAKLEQTRRRFSFHVYGFVVMPEHVHLLLSEPERALLANAIQSLKIAAAKRSAATREFDGKHSPLWYKRYYDRNIRSYTDFLEKLGYIHRNPVKRGLVEKAEDWKWSSFRHYARGEDCGVELESEWTARKRERAAGRLAPTVGWLGAPHLAALHYR